MWSGHNRPRWSGHNRCVGSNWPQWGLLPSRLPVLVPRFQNLPTLVNWPYTRLHQHYINLPELKFPRFLKFSSVSLDRTLLLPFGVPVFRRRGPPTSSFLCREVCRRVFHPTGTPGPSEVYFVLRPPWRISSPVPISSRTTHRQDLALSFTTLYRSVTVPPLSFPNQTCKTRNWLGSYHLNYGCQIKFSHPSPGSLVSRTDWVGSPTPWETVNIYTTSDKQLTYLPTYVVPPSTVLRISS